MALKPPPPRLRPGINIDRRFAHAAVSVVHARQALEPLANAVDPGTLETLRLLVTELVGNSVRHGIQQATDDIELSVRASREGVRVEVANSGPGFTPLPREEDAAEGSGWGLHLLEALSDRWGTEEDERMRVWFELVDSGAFAPPVRLDAYVSTPE